MPLRLRWLAFLWLLVSSLAVQAASSGSSAPQAHLQFVVYLGRHGVRSPTGDPARYDAFSVAPWPKWGVPPGYLTPHGFELMKRYGAYDRAYLASEALLAKTGCADANQVSILADSDQRTRETGRALAEGMFPGCTVAVHALAEGVADPLFHSSRAGVRKRDSALALAAFEGSIGGEADNLTAAYRPQLQVLDRILAGCGLAAAESSSRNSIFAAPVKKDDPTSDRDTDLRGPLSTASSIAESLLLEYAEGMHGNSLGWGCLNEENLREVMQLHTAHSQYTDRTLVVARAEASNLLAHILNALEQSACGKLVVGAPGSPGDRALFLVGHDTNIAALAGLLNLHWIVDGRPDDTPPGGALVFELWRSVSGAYSVRIGYTAQSLGQMRNTQMLTLAHPPLRVPVFVPDCGRPDMSCSLERFSAAVQRAIDPADVQSGGQ
jgi:4-phytase / acid phosphatase